MTSVAPPCGAVDVEAFTKETFFPLKSVLWPAVIFFSFSSSVHVNTATMFPSSPCSCGREGVVVVSQVTSVTSRWQERTTFPLP